MLHLEGLARKLFTSLALFLAVFALVSLCADLCYLGRNASNEPSGEIWPGRPDFSVLWEAGYNFSRLAQDAANRPVYDTGEEFYHFRYSPFMAMVMAPFGMIRNTVAALFLWSILLNLLFLAALLLLGRQLHSDFGATSQQRCIIYWGAFLGTLRYYLMDLGQGQTDVVIALLFVLLVSFYSRGRDILCGVIIALILQMKPMFLPVLVYFLFRKKIKIFASAAAVFCGLQALPALVIGMGNAVELAKGWWNVLNMSIPSQLLNLKNQSLPYAITAQALKIPALRDAVSPRVMIYSLSLALLVCVYAAAVLARRWVTRQDETRYRYLEISVLVISSLVLSPIAWPSHFTSLVLPIGAAVYFTLISPRRDLLYAALGAYLALSLVGTDLTKSVPIVHNLRFVNISLGTLFLAAAILYSYKKTRD